MNCLALVKQYRNYLYKQATDKVYGKTQNIHASRQLPYCLPDIFINATIQRCSITYMYS